MTDTTATILRNPSRERYTVIDNGAIRDGRLGWAATGLLAYLLSLPDNWRVNLKHLSEQKPDGETATRTAFRRLEDLGYVTRVVVRDARMRIIRHEIHVHETPPSTDTEEQVVSTFRVSQSGDSPCGNSAPKKYLGKKDLETKPPATPSANPRAQSGSVGERDAAEGLGGPTITDLLVDEWHHHRDQLGLPRHDDRTLRRSMTGFCGLPDQLRLVLEWVRAKGDYAGKAGDPNRLPSQWAQALEKATIWDRQQASAPPAPWVDDDGIVHYPEPQVVVR